MGSTSIAYFLVTLALDGNETILFPSPSKLADSLLELKVDEDIFMKSVAGKIYPKTIEALKDALCLSDCFFEENSFLSLSKEIERRVEVCNLMQVFQFEKAVRDHLTTKENPYFVLIRQEFIRKLNNSIPLTGSLLIQINPGIKIMPESIDYLDLSEEQKTYLFIITPLSCEVVPINEFAALILSFLKEQTTVSQLKNDLAGVIEFEDQSELNELIDSQLIYFLRSGFVSPYSSILHE